MSSATDTSPGAEGAAPEPSPPGSGAAPVVVPTPLDMFGHGVEWTEAEPAAADDWNAAAWHPL